MVQFEDGSVKAQMGLPDMRLPIQFALGYPQRYPSKFERFDFVNYPELTFEKPDRDIFRNLDLAYHSIHQGGNMPCILNAANEVAVEAFLGDSIGFLEISDIVETCLAKSTFISSPGYDDYVASDKEVRIRAKELIN
jgi:1-deoxy-D-xylulose-5-phosphate reductoisomerase